jgi:DNA-binding MarR family transcriptional regulator
MPGHAENAREIMEVLRAAQNGLRARFLKLLLPHRLTMPQHKALQHIHWHSREGGLSIGEISEHLGLACSTVSGIVDRLERDGWVRRNRGTSDRRKVKVEPTEKAEKLLSQKAIDTEDFWFTTIGRLTEEEQATLVNSLRRLREVMEEPSWPSHDDIHAAEQKAQNGQENEQQTLDQIWREEVRSIGIRSLLARRMDQDGNSEIAAYLRQAAHEEAGHALALGALLGKIDGVKESLSSLAEAEQRSLQLKLDAAELHLQEEVITLLEQTAEDEKRHRQWFRRLAAKYG